MKALVLCAGFGTRLGELTRDTPKPLLPIQGQPLLAYTLRYLAHFGFDEVAINVHYRAEQIRDFVGDGSQFGVKAHIVYEELPLGTAGAVKNLQEYFRNQRDFLVMYGDLLIDQDLRTLVEFHRAQHAEATVLVHQRKRSNSVVSLDTNNRITAFVERPHNPEEFGHPHYVNSGVYLLSQSILDQLPTHVPLDFPKDIFPSMAQDRRRLYGLPLTGYRCAIDSVTRYQEAEAALCEGTCQVF